jgi:transposase InsO family protein
MRVVMTVLAGVAAVSMLSACATRTQVAHEGDLPSLKGQVVLTEAAPAGSDAALAEAIEARVRSQVGAIGAGASAPRYRLQVAVASSPTQVGITTAAGPQVGVAPWRSGPDKLHFWTRRGPVRTATLAVLDLSTGKVTAWASVRSSSADATLLANHLVAALTPAKG